MTPECPECGSKKTYRQTSSPLRYRCDDCDLKFDPRVNRRERPKHAIPPEDHDYYEPL
jgi:rubredoxin